MKKVFLVLGIILVTGCVVRSYEVEKPRKDIGVDGNQGYLTGTGCDEIKKTGLGKTRKVSVWEIEFGARKHEKPSKKIYQEPVTTVSTSEKDSIGDSGDEYKEEPTFTESIQESTKAGSLEGEYQEYTVEKNDTLQKISQKFYGTTKKWKDLYDLNQEVLKAPDKIYPGLKIRIPASL